jgi:hypothetical protein
MAIKHCSECYRAFEASIFRTFQRGEPVVYCRCGSYTKAGYEEKFGEYGSFLAIVAATLYTHELPNRGANK